MPGTALWFVFVLAALPAAWFTGQWAGRIQDTWRRACVIGSVFTMLLGWALLVHHPAIAVELIPVAALARLEGIGAAPLFVFVLGVGWCQAVMIRQRAILVLGMFLGVGYFVQGGIWMMRPTPDNAFGRQSNKFLVYQSQDYSCVPAASATAMHLMGMRSSEKEMAELTETRKGSGATLLRALHGLRTRLKHTGFEPYLLEPDYEQLMRIEPPMLTPLQYESSRLHMVTIVEVRPSRVLVADPEVGLEFIPREEFEYRYRGQVIAFDGKGQRVTPQQVLAQNPHITDPDGPQRVSSSGD